MLSFAVHGASILTLNRFLGTSTRGAGTVPGQGVPNVGVELTGAQTALLAAQVGIAALGAYLVAIVVGVVLKRAGRRSPMVQTISHRTRRPFRALLVLVAMRIAIAASKGNNTWLEPVTWAIGTLIVVAIAWLLVGAVMVAEDEVLRRYRVDVVDNRHARRVRTQASFLRRLVVGIIALIAVAAVLLTIPGVKNVGTTILASAGFLSIVAGLAAQSALGNVFAGLQIAFTDSLRVEDVVIVETQFGRVEEITLTYVVVRTWDERRLVLPSTYFTTTPFENWTRKESELTGAVLIDVDWRTDFDAMREELHRVLEEDDLYDGRIGVLQVTDAEGSVVQVRALCSAADAGSAFDLRCHVRESLVRWLVSHPAGLPRVRQVNTEETELPSVAPLTWTEQVAGPTGWELPEASPQRDPSAPTPVVSATGKRLAVKGDSLFTGSPEAEERARQFSGPSERESAGRDVPADEVVDEVDAVGVAQTGRMSGVGTAPGGSRRASAPPTVALPTLRRDEATGRFEAPRTDEIDGRDRTDRLPRDGGTTGKLDATDR